MAPEFSENCIVIIDPGMQIHNRAYAVVRYEGEMYFRQYLERGKQKFLVPLNTQHEEIELIHEFETVGCVVQQKQRKQKGLHYYHLNSITGEMDFTLSGKEKHKDT
jgi:SOS-response transcriptional repressor LexA